MKINQREIERILLREAKEKEAIEQKRIIIDRLGTFVQFKLLKSIVRKR